MRESIEEIITLPRFDPSRSGRRPWSVHLTRLHKNLAELEWRLREANPSTLKDTAGKTDFLKALFAGRAPPTHILYLAGRLRTVDRALRDWEDFDRPAGDGLCELSACTCTAHKCVDEAQGGK